MASAVTLTTVLLGLLALAGARIFIAPPPPPDAPVTAIVDHVNVAAPEDLNRAGLRKQNRTEVRRDNIDERGPYYGGDMVLNEDQLEDFKAGILGSSYRWPGGKIPYVLDPYFTAAEKSTVMSGINMIQSASCIRFVPRSSESSYVNIVRGGSGTGCYADVGKQSGRVNTVNLQYNGCVTAGIAAHELIHAIGYYHEQSRPDRDDYVTINWGNIQSGRSFNFDKYTTSQVSSFGVPYDYDSVMHYSAYAFAVNTNTPTIYPRNTAVAYSRLGQRSALSSYDGQKINAMYSGIC